MHEQRKAQGVTHRNRGRSFHRNGFGLGLIYARMREKTHSASTQLKGTVAFEGTVTGSHQSVGSVGNEPK